MRAGARPPAIEVNGIRKSFRRQAGWRDIFRRPPLKPVLQGVDLAVERGEIFGLLGPNGAGKTTLIKVLVGLVLPDAGHASVAGHDVVSDSLQVRRLIGAVYGEERSFFWRLSVRENLRFFAGLQGVHGAAADRRIDELLELVDLRDSAGTRMYALSSGMKQRASIARGLLHDPEIIFMDEPTRSLDPIGAGDLHRLIRERVAAAGRTVLIATHSMSEAEHLCHRLALIDRGVTALAGTAREFRASVGTELVYRLQVEAPDEEVDWSQRLRALPGVLTVGTDTLPDGTQEIRIAMRDNAATLPAVMRLLVESSVQIRSCVREEIPLDEVFRRVVQHGRRELALAVAE